MSKPQDKDTEKLYKHARQKVMEIFKKHGLVSYRKIGLQRSLRDALVESAMTGNIKVNGKETFRHIS